MLASVVTGLTVVACALPVLVGGMHVVGELPAVAAARATAVIVVGGVPHVGVVSVVTVEGFGGVAAVVVP